MRRATPAWVGVAMLAGILFGPTAMHPSDLTGASLGEPVVGAALLGLWLVLIGPVGTVLVDDRPTAYLRTLPAGRGWPWGAQALFALLAQAPWALLWWLGEGPPAGIAAAALAAVLMVGAASLRWPWPARAPRWRRAVTALIGVHARAVVRRRAASIWRGLALALLGGALAGLIGRHNGLSTADAMVALLAVSSVSLPAAVGALTAPVAESDRDLSWVLASSGCGPGTRVVAMGVTLGLVGAALGAAAGAIAAAMAGAALLVVAGAAQGAILGVIAVRVGAWAVAVPGGDGTRVVLGALATATASIVAVGVMGAVALAVLAASAGVLVAPLATPREAA